MNNKTVINIAKTIIWICLAVILFSPLYLHSKIFFPFIVTKTIPFNIAVEIMFVAFLFLVFKSRGEKLSDRQYKIKISIAVVLMAIYIISSLISSLLGDYFFRSFWSNNERSEGIILLLHLFLFLIVLTGFLRRLKIWLVAFDIFFFSSLLVSLFALGQYLKVPWLFASSGNTRLAGTIGNAGYMAGYLVFAIFIGLFLLFRRRQLILKYYYGAVIALQIFIVLNTFTRGGMLALFATALTFICYLLFFYFKNKRLKQVGIAVIVLSVIFITLVFTGKKTELVNNNKILQRIASISISATTAQNRLITWNSSWQGFKERPVWGWGYENFYQPFDKYYDPEIFRHAGSVVWFDRAHNIVFDRLSTGGILGLISYLSLLFLPFYYLWKNYYGKHGDSKRFFLPMIFTLIIFAYFVQNLFIFEALVTYVPLFLVLAFVGLFGKQYDWQAINKESNQKLLLVIFAILLIPTIYFVNIRPLRANIDLTMAINEPELSLEQRLNLFKKVFSQNTNGNQEYRRQMFAVLERASREQGVDQQLVLQLMQLTESELAKQLKENPHSVANYLLVMRFNNFMFNRTMKADYINRNIGLFEKAKKLSPKRQHVYFEIGYSYLYLANALKGSGQIDQAVQDYDKAIEFFKYAVDLNDKNFESYKQLASIYIFAGRNGKVVELIDELDRKNPARYNKIDFLRQIINTSIPVKNYEIIKLMANKLIEINPDDPQYLTQLALAHAYLGEDSKAIAIANKVGLLGGEYKEQSDAFIERVRAGEYKK